MKLFVILVERDCGGMDCHGIDCSEFVLANSKQEALDFIKSEDNQLENLTLDSVLEADFSVFKKLRKPREISWHSFLNKQKELTQTKG